MQLHDLLALAVGLLLGGLFALLKLPIPAPVSVGGILGIIGVASGAAIVGHLIA